MNPEQFHQETSNTYTMLLTSVSYEKLKRSGLVDSISPQLAPDTVYFDAQFPLYVMANKWTVDNYGPIWIPKKGAAVTLTEQNYPIYERAIRVYEHNSLTKENGKYILNGKEATSYTFKMDYYWMMGDNRHGSQDSRFWGFVPEDHIVGKASLIWFSWDNGPRWKRLFSTVK